MIILSMTYKIFTIVLEEKLMSEEQSIPYADEIV